MFQMSKSPYFELENINPKLIGIVKDSNGIFGHKSYFGVFEIPDTQLSIRFIKCSIVPSDGMGACHYDCYLGTKEKVSSFLINLF